MSYTLRSVTTFLHDFLVITRKSWRNVSSVLYANYVKFSIFQVFHNSVCYSSRKSKLITILGLLCVSLPPLRLLSHSIFLICLSPLSPPSPPSLSLFSFVSVFISFSRQFCHLGCQLFYLDLFLEEEETLLDVLTKQLASLSSIICFKLFLSCC